jgi:IclR family transcriptional regulator, pca regulon regulatory protein
MVLTRRAVNSGIIVLRDSSTYERAIGPSGNGCSDPEEGNDMRKADEATEANGDPLMVHSVEKAFRVLNAFDQKNPRLSLAQLSAIIGSDKSTAQRFAHTLVRLGYLAKDPTDRSLSLTVKTLGPAHNYLKTTAVVSVAMPYLMHLHQETGETVNLTILDGTESVFVMRMVGSHILSTDVIVGTRIPAYCSASGLAILAALEVERAEAVLAASDLQPVTENTVWRIGEIRRRLRQIRKQGYITTHGEYYTDDVSTGAAILDRSGHPVGAISIAVSRARFALKDADKRFSSLTVAAARSVSI